MLGNEAARKLLSSGPQPAVVNFSPLGGKIVTLNATQR